jgi:peroxiredoxin
MNNKYLILVAIFSLVVFNATAQHAISNSSPIESMACEKVFGNIDYENPELYSSGKFFDLIERQFWIIQTSGLDDATKLKEMTKSVDIILDSVQKDEKLYNDLTKYLFQYFEKYSLFPASEYIALKALNQKDVALNSSLTHKLESYRLLRVGNRAPDFELIGDVFRNGKIVNNKTRLTDIKAKYKLVIFGASWCEQCRFEMTQLLPRYEELKSKGVEVVFISLDTDNQEFQKFTAQFPFLSSCDYKKWESQVAKQYYISSSPTFFLLDKHNKILSRPVSIQHVQTFIEKYAKNKL